MYVMKVKEYLLLFHELGRSKTSVSDLSLTPVLFLLLLRKSGDFFKKTPGKIDKLDTFFSKKPFNSDTLEFRAIYIKRKRDHDEIGK